MAESRHDANNSTSQAALFLNSNLRPSASTPSTLAERTPHQGQACVSRAHSCYVPHSAWLEERQAVATVLWPDSLVTTPSGLSESVAFDGRRWGLSWGGAVGARPQPMATLIEVQSTGSGRSPEGWLTHWWDSQLCTVPGRTGSSAHLFSIPVSGPKKNWESRFQYPHAWKSVSQP